MKMYRVTLIVTDEEIPEALTREQIKQGLDVYPFWDKHTVNMEISQLEEICSIPSNNAYKKAFNDFQGSTSIGTSSGLPSRVRINSK